MPHEYWPSGPVRDDRDYANGGRGRGRDFDRDRRRRPDPHRPNPPRRASEFDNRDLFPDTAPGAKITQRTPPHVRSEIYSDNTPVKSSPLAAAKPKTASSPNIGRESELQRLTDLICHRMFWYMQRDSSDKKQKKLQAELDRCKLTRTEFPSALEILSAQLKQADEEKAKCCKRLEDTDDKLQAAVRSFVDTYCPPANTESSKATPSVPTGPSKVDIESRLADFQRQMKQDFTKQLEEKMQKMENTIQGQHEVETTALKKRLASESKRNDALQERMESLVCRLDELDRTVVTKDPDSNAPSLASIGKTVTSHKQELTDLSKRLGGLSENMVTKQDMKESLAEYSEAEMKKSNSRNLLAQETAAANHDIVDSRLNSMESSLETEMEKTRTSGDIVKQCLADASAVKSQVTELETLLKKQTDEQKSTHVVVATLQSSLSSKEAERGVGRTTPKLANPMARNAQADTRANEAKTVPASISDDRIMQIVMPQLDRQVKRLEDSFKKIVAGVGPVLDSERTARIALKGQLDREVERIFSTAKELSDLKAKLDQTIETQTKQQTIDKGCQKSSFDAVYAHLNDATRGINLHIDELSMQLQCMNAWQNNFTTRDLYKQITDHIVATLPGGMAKQVRALSARLDAAEKRFQGDSESSTTKKRKFQNGEAVNPNS